MRRVERASEIDASMPILRADLPQLPWHETLILRLARALDQSMIGFFRVVLSHHGLNEGLLHTLMLVYCLREEDVTPSLLCSLVAQSPANMTRILQTLEDRRLIERATSEFDGRKSHIRLTAQGQRMLLDTLPQTIEPVQLALSGLAPDEQEQFERLLRKAISSIDKATDSCCFPVRKSAAAASPVIEAEPCQ